MIEFEEQLRLAIKSIETMLLTKNKEYGNSALEPVCVFNKSVGDGAILARIDDKLSRIKNLSPNDDLWDRADDINDLIGYLILLKIKMEI